MKRLFTLFFLWGLFVPFAGAQNTDTMPTPEEIKAVNDSILGEAYQLYLHERVAWFLEDLFFENASEDLINEVEGWVPFTDDGITVKGVFFNKERTKSLFDTSINIETGEDSLNVSARDLTEEEIKAINAYMQIIDAVHSLDSIPSCPEGCTFNVEVLGLGEDSFRVYWMLGTTQHGIIPFGCDFSYDCDSEGTIKAFRLYHNSFIPTPLMIDGEPVREITHSHNLTSPYITPTDIALFLLYGYNVSELTGFKVYSSILNCYFVFDAETYEIRVEAPKAAWQSGNEPRLKKVPLS